VEALKTQAPAIGNVRLVLGTALFAAGFLSPLLIPLVVNSDLPGNWKAFLSTGLVAGLPEVGMVLAIAVLGKEGFAWLKQKVFTFLRKQTEPAAVSKARYRAGLVLFCIPLLIGWLQPYLAHFLPGLIPGTGPLLSAFLLDLVFAISLLVLGAGFWQKLRALFVYP